MSAPRDVSNIFGVACIGGRVTILNQRPLSGSMRREDALLLAAWLVAVADRSERQRDFEELLTAVLDT